MEYLKIGALPGRELVPGAYAPGGRHALDHVGVSVRLSGSAAVLEPEATAQTKREVYEGD